MPTVTCPSCGRESHLPPSFIGSCTCFMCGKPFSVTSPTPPEPPADLPAVCFGDPEEFVIEEAETLTARTGGEPHKGPECPERVQRGKAAAMPNVSCPSCGKEGNVPPRFIGSVRCKKCATMFQAAPGAKLKVTCPSCRGVRDIPPIFIGSVKCRQCSTIFQAALGTKPKVTCPSCGMVGGIPPNFMGSINCSQCHNDFLAAHGVATWPKAPAKALVKSLTIVVLVSVAIVGLLWSVTSLLRRHAFTFPQSMPTSQPPSSKKTLPDVIPSHTRGMPTLSSQPKPEPPKFDPATSSQSTIAELKERVERWKSSKEKLSVLITSLQKDRKELLGRLDEIGVKSVGDSATNPRAKVLLDSSFPKKLHYK